MYAQVPADRSSDPAHAAQLKAGDETRGRSTTAQRRGAGRALKPLCRGAGERFSFGVQAEALSK